MGFFKGGFLTISCALLFLSILSLTSILTLKSSLEYENIQEQISERMLSISENTTLVSVGEDPFKTKGLDISKKANETLVLMAIHCEQNEEYVFTFEERAISINCSTQGNKNNISSEIAKSFIEDFYYKEYNCGFWSCFVKEETPYFLISEKAKDYWAGKIYFLLITSLILAGIIFFLVEQNSNWPIIIGTVIVTSSISLFKMQGIFYKIISLRDIQGTSHFMEVLFSKVATASSIGITFGIVVIGIGIFLRFFYSDLLKKKFSKEDVREIIKEEKAKNIVTKDSKKDTK
ncbi:MAG: hypothetical protein Q8P81_00685 [Nanoarchaeota archaeon]|nr:hypothetical protein [Nanoarchaeota archaeon]